MTGSRSKTNLEEVIDGPVGLSWLFKQALDDDHSRDPQCGIVKIQVLQQSAVGSLVLKCHSQRSACVGRTPHAAGL